MSRYDDHPAYRINKWVTQVLRDEDIIPEAADYLTDLDGEENFTLPFMMVGSQTPESSTPYNGGHYKSLPFCIYTVEQTGGHDQPWTRHGNLTYIFYADSSRKLIEIAQCVHDLTNREDWSATDINHFYRMDANYPFDFKYICFQSGSGPAPAQDEGGRMAYMCIIEYDAVYEGTGRNGNYGAITGLGRI
jgi:hypothetical protein